MSRFAALPNLALVISLGFGAGPVMGATSANFNPPPSFHRVFSGDASYTVSAFVENPATHEFIVAASFPAATTQARLNEALKLLTQQLVEVPSAEIGKPTKVCGKDAILSTFNGSEHGKTFSMDKWMFVDGDTGYAILYSRPSSVSRSATIVRRIQAFCPSQEQMISSLNFPKQYQTFGTPKVYHMHGVWVYRTLGGDEEQIDSFSGTGLQTDPSLSVQYMKRAGWTILVDERVRQCGIQMQHQILSGDGVTTERYLATTGATVSVLSYARPDTRPRSHEVATSLRTFCASQPQTVDLVGQWGGKGIRLIIRPTQAFIFFDGCSSGGISNGFPGFRALDSASFNLAGTLVQADGAERQIWYRAVVRGPAMALQLAELSGKSIASYSLKKESAGSLRRCVRARTSEGLIR